MTESDTAPVLILGHTGKLGRALMRAFADSGNVVGLNSGDFDAREPGIAARLLIKVKPALVLNTVAMQGIDRCFLNPVEADCVNAQFPEELAEAAEARGIWLAHFSTECVFADAVRGFCTESTAPAPLNVYGRTKLDGERRVLAAHPGAYVFRLPLLFGEDPRAGQFVERMLGELRAGKAVAAAGDVITSPTYVEDAAACVRSVLDQGMTAGLYHVTNTGEASLHALLQALAEDLKLPGSIRRASHREFIAKDRKNVRTPLASEKLPAMRSWREAVKAFAERDQDGTADERG